MSKASFDGQNNVVNAATQQIESSSSEVPEDITQQTNEQAYFELEDEKSQLNSEIMETESTGSHEKQEKKKSRRSDRKKRNSFIQSLKDVLNKDKNSDGKSDGKGHMDSKHSDTKSSKRSSLTGGPAHVEGDSSPSGVEKQKGEGGADDRPIYELARELEKSSEDKNRKSKWGSGYSDSLRSNVSLGNRGCLEGVGAPVPVDFTKSPQQINNSNSELEEYSKAFMRSTEVQLNNNDIERLRAKGFNNLEKTHNSADHVNANQDNKEEDDDCCPTESEGEDYDWGSEFDDDEDDVYNEPDVIGDKEESIYEKPLPKPPRNKVPSGLQGLLARSKSIVTENMKPGEEEMTTCLPVTINPQKHPPPFLPSEPENLSDNQRKRRMIISLIIQSEQSYLESLERILKDYEKPILEYIPNSKLKLKHVFSQLRDIISHHKMFQIELSEIARNWDEDEKIGDTFTASFSKSMLVDSYSMYVNNFAASMEEIRTLRRHKASFDEFLKSQEKLGVDRLSIFGLMVKPVQRFPQFMMFIQDLIKYTPQKHHDRQALQLALTELENIAYKLNERKRQSEQEFQAQQIVHKLVKNKVQHVLMPWNFSHDANRRSLRSDMMEQITGEFDSMKCKNRRIILLNDRVLCVKVIEKEQSGFVVERLVLRWYANLSDLELKDTAITPAMLSVEKKDSEKFECISLRLECPEEDPYHLYADLKEMLHDHNVLGQISGLLASLKRSYAGHGLNEELIHEVSSDLQRMIQLKDEQLRLVNSCSIVLEDVSKSDKPHYVLQTQSAAMKQDWCVDFLMAKLAVEKCNTPAWDGSISGDVIHDSIPAVFMRHLPVDAQRTYTKIKCAVSIFMNPENSPFGVGVQHLWVCSSSEKLGQISLLSIHNSKPSLMESFKACSCEITAVELVPGCGNSSSPESYLFAEDTVWMSTAMKEILIFSLTSVDGAHRCVISTIKLTSAATSLKFVDERFFCGFDNGAMAVYSRSDAGHWEVLTPAVLRFGNSEVKIHFIHEEDLYLSCENKLFIVEIDSLQLKAQHELMTESHASISNIVKSGVGIWVSFKDSSVIKLFHIESMANLQELSLGNFVNRIRTERLWSLSGATENLVVTCLAISKGLLWIGTSTGLILTVPLPRLSDGVPLYRGKPNISLHAHKGPVRFLISLNCSTSTLELNGASSLRSILKSRHSKRNTLRERVEYDLAEQVNDTNVTSPVDTKNPAEAVNNLDEGLSNLPQFSVERTVSVRSTPPGLLTDEEAEAVMEWEEQQEAGEAKITRARDTGRKTSFEENSVGLRRSSRHLKKGSRRRPSSGAGIAEQPGLGETNVQPGEKPHEVEMFYEVLMEEDIERTEKDIYSEVVNTDKGNGLPSGSAHCALTSTPGGQYNTQSCPPGTYHLSPSSPTSVPLSPSNSTASADSSREAAELSTRGLARGATLRKIKPSNNAVIVLSGGDGYCDLDYSRNQGKTDCASVMLWIYKY
ncbi:Rho guanine nucleotide exchange factor 10 [Bulinus truncatus]|nr:Rho guanine nucleotide exchange factor 10 [Bulinus truncatus]